MVTNNQTDFNFKSSTSNFRQIEKKILDSIIGDGKEYDSRIRPSGNNKTSHTVGNEMVLTGN